MSILIAYSWEEAIAIPDPKAISWVGPGNRYEVRTGSDIPLEVPLSLPSQGGGVSADSLIASSGAGMVGFKPAGTGMATRTLDKKLSEITTLHDASGVADYAGTPLYDGADAARVTATDNTLALSVLISRAISDGSGVVRIPAGRWGIKTGNLSFANFDRIVFVGEGIGVSVLDFIKDDTTKIGYVDNEGARAANCIAKFDTGNYIEFRNLTIKATTRAGIVNGTSGPANAAAVYYGSVWGFKVKNVGEVVFDRVRVERFNYRGFSVYGTATKKVSILNCQGRYNTSTGFWINDAALLDVSGGEFSYNGIRGEPGTGYGVTASSNVGRVVVKGAYFHHNYRKGLDTHGCGGMDVSGCTFEHNVVYHLAAPNWNVPSGVSDVIFTINGNTFNNGGDSAGRAFLADAYGAMVANGYAGQGIYQGGIVSIVDVDATSVRQSKIKRIEFHGNTVIAHYNGFSLASWSGVESTYAIEMWVRDDGLVSWKGNRINLEGLKFPAAGQSSAAIPISIPFGSWELDDDKVSWLEDASFANSNYSTISPISVTWAANTATVTLPEGHNYRDGEIIAVSGADQAAFNGVQILSKIDTNTYTYPCANPGVGTATGAITLTVKDIGQLVTTVGINVTARSTKFALNNARLFGSTYQGRSSEATFNAASRDFSGCVFSWVDAPFQSIENAFFLGRQGVGSWASSGNWFANRGVTSRLPDGTMQATASSAPYSLRSISKSAGEDVVSLVVDRALPASITVTNDDGTAPLVLSATASSVTEAAAGARFALSAFEIVASDGAMAKKMKVVLKAKSAMNGNFSGSVAVQSAAGGVGVERFVRL